MQKVKKNSIRLSSAVSVASIPSAASATRHVTIPAGVPVRRARLVFFHHRRRGAIARPAKETAVGVAFAQVAAAGAAHVASVGRLGQLVHVVSVVTVGQHVDQHLLGHAIDVGAPQPERQQLQVAGDVSAETRQATCGENARVNAISETLHRVHTGDGHSNVLFQKALAVLEQILHANWCCIDS